MPKFVGRGVSVGFGKETVRGTAVAPSAWFAKTNLSFDDKYETILDEASYGTISDSLGQAVVKKWSEGEVGGNLGVNAMSFPFYAMFGSVVTTTDTGTAKKHTFSLLESYQSPSLTIAIDDAVQDRRFALCVVESITIKVEPKKYVEVSMNFMGKPSATSTETVAFTQDYLLVANQMTLVWASNLAGLDAASATHCIKSFEITMTRVLTDDECVGSITPTDWLSTTFKVEGNVEITYENEADYRTKSFAGTTQAMRFNVTDGNTIIGGVTSSPELEIDLAKVGFTEWSRTVSTNEVVTQSVGFKGFYSLSDAKTIVARLINTVATI